MDFFKENSDDACVLKNVSYETKDKSKMPNFKKEFWDVFMDDVTGKLPPKRGQDDSSIDIIPASSPPNKPPYRVFKLN